MKVYAIGDIHGCRSELAKMHEYIDRYIQPEDHVVYIGDYIDRGPDSKGVVDDIIARMKSHPNPHYPLLGNHEDMMMDGTYGWSYNGGDKALRSYGLDPFEPNMDRDFFRVHCPDDHREFYSNLRYYVRIGKTVFVHANIDPGLEMEDQSESDMLWNRNLDNYKGDYLGGVTVVRGHTPITNVRELPNQILIDTGCVFGNKLTCLIIDPFNPEDRHFWYIKSEQPEW